MQQTTAPSLAAKDEHPTNHSTHAPGLWVFVLLGGLAGLFTGQLILLTELPEIFYLILIFVMLSIGLGLSTPLNKDQSWLKLIALLIFNGLILAFALWWNTHDVFGYIGSRSGLGFTFFLAALSAIAIVTAFIQAWQKTPPRLDYSRLFENAWNNALIVILAFVFTGAFLAVLSLGTNLFENIGLEWLDDFVWDDNILPVIVGMLLGAGICVSRHHHAVIYRVRLLVFALLKALAILSAIIIITFSLSLPFTVDQLFSHNSTSAILLILTGLSILLLNTLVDKGSDQLPRWQNYLFMLQIILLPVLVCLSLYAIHLRIEQYGLMPGRVIAALLAVILTLYVFSYLYGLIRERKQWSETLTQSNPILAMITLGVILLVFARVIDPVKMSIDSQLSSLKSGLITPEKFDFYTLKNRMGKPGNEAIKAISSWDDHPQIALIRKEIKANKRHHNRVVNLEIVPDPALPADMSSLSSYQCEEKRNCIAKLLPVGGDGKLYIVLFAFSSQRDYMDTYIYRYDEKRWIVAQSYRSDQSLAEGQYDTLVKKIRSGDVEMIQPRFMDMRVDGIDIR